MARSFKNLLVWQRGMALAEGVYGLAKTFPRHEQYGLCDQMRRAGDRGRIDKTTNRRDEIDEWI